MKRWLNFEPETDLIISGLSSIPTLKPLLTALAECRLKEKSKIPLIFFFIIYLMLLYHITMLTKNNQIYLFMLYIIIYYFFFFRIFKNYISLSKMLILNYSKSCTLNTLILLLCLPYTLYTHTLHVSYT